MKIAASDVTGWWGSARITLLLFRLDDKSFEKKVINHIAGPSRTQTREVTDTR
jgi:hypothetical protein